METLLDKCDSLYEHYTSWQLWSGVVIWWLGATNCWTVVWAKTSAGLATVDPSGVCVLTSLSVSSNINNSSNACFCPSVWPSFKDRHGHRLHRRPLQVCFPVWYKLANVGMYMIGFDTRYSHVWEWDPGRASDYDIFYDILLRKLSECNFNKVESYRR